MSDHDHNRAGKHSHSHGVSADADSKRLTVAFALIVGFMAVEVVVGIIVHSLALLSDAAHMLTDAGALAASLVVIRLVQRPAGGDLTYGLKRTEILSAQANGATLLVLAGLIIYEGVNRLINPPAAGGLAILIVALVGIGVNLLATWQLAKANRESMNIEGSFHNAPSAERRSLAWLAAARHFDVRWARQRSNGAHAVTTHRPKTVVLQGRPSPVWAFMARLTTRIVG